MFYRRTCATNVRVLPTYVCYRRTYSINVRVLPGRTYSGLRFGDPDSGLRSRGVKSRDYAVENRGVGTTQNILDLVEEDRRQLVSGLRLETQIIIDTLVIYHCNVTIKLQFSCLYITAHSWYLLSSTIPTEFWLELG